MIELSGTIQNVRFRNDNGFSIGIIFLHPDSFQANQKKLEELFHPHQTRNIPFAGNCDLNVNDKAILTGEFVRNPKYGNQFKVATAQPDMDIASGGLQTYIAHHPELTGIGPVKARKLVETYGEKLIDECKNNPAAVAQFLGVKIDTILKLNEVFAQDKAIFQAKTWLAGFGISHKKITRIVEHYKAETYSVLQENPYLLIKEIETFGFKRVDEIARKIGIPKENPKRIREGILFCLAEEERSGNTWTSQTELIESANKLLILDRLDSKDLIQRELEYLSNTSQKQLIQFQDNRCALQKTYERENWLRYWFEVNRERKNIHFPSADEIALPPGLDPNGQEQFVRNCLRWQISIGTGGAGTGKTFAITALINMYETFGKDVVCCAPTGKAARRISQLTGHPAETIHKLLCYDGDTYHANEIDGDVIIIDESSMIDIDLAWQLFTRIDLSRQAVVIVGDHNQLPPVGCGYLLRDLVERNLAQCTRLHTVLRQAEILKHNSTKILDGIVCGTPNKNNSEEIAPWYLFDTLADPEKLSVFIAEMFEQHIEGRFGLNPLTDVQVLTPMHKGNLGTNELNKLIQGIIQRKIYKRELNEEEAGKIQPGDKVIQCRNNRELEIMNGTLGIVERRDPNRTLWVKFEFSDKAIAIDFEDQADLKLAYALTVHKSQGSEFPMVIIVCHRSHYIMLNRNLLYTGVTRARNYCVILGDTKGLQVAVKNTQSVERRTWMGL